MKPYIFVRKRLIYVTLKHMHHFFIQLEEV